MSKYQQKVNKMVGAMGPTVSANWKNTMTTNGSMFDLAAHPLYYSPAIGKYVSSFEPMGYVSFSYGKKKKKSTKKGAKKKRYSRK